jgi:hypothetical protein
MPFTPAHTAVVLPFLKNRYASATGLVIGSMAPDFEYFFKMQVSGVHSHTWAGLLYFDLPVTLALSMVFHLVAKRNLINNLPAFLQRRFSYTLHLNFPKTLRSRPLVFVLSALAGSASHIIWDGFTHGRGFFVNYFSFYDGAYLPFDGVNYPLWYALQHISTFVGLAAVVIYVFALEAKGNFVAPRLVYWLILLLISVSVVALRFAIHPADYALGNVVVSSVSALCIALILCGLIRFNNPTAIRQGEPVSK